MTFVLSLVRIDDRLIHGQVTTTWSKVAQVEEIIVVNDLIAQDTLRTFLLRQAAPYYTQVHVLSVYETQKLYQSNLLLGKKVMLLFTNPLDILSLIKKGLPILEVNVGGMSFQIGKKRLTNFVAVFDEEKQAFKELLSLGVQVELRKVPADKKVFLKHLLKKETSGFLPNEMT